jgi:hypothetical protein
VQPNRLQTKSTIANHRTHYDQRLANRNKPKRGTVGLLTVRVEPDWGDRRRRRIDEAVIARMDRYHRVNGDLELRSRYYRRSDVSRGWREVWDWRNGRASRLVPRRKHQEAARFCSKGWDREPLDDVDFDVRTDHWRSFWDV